MEQPLVVFESPFIAGWDGSEEGFTQIEAAPVRPPDSDVWTRKWETDAHCVAYYVPGETRMPRLNKSAYKAVLDQGGSVCMGWAIVDLDNPGHAEWTPELVEETFKTLRTLPEFDHAGWYFTKHGMRLVWPLETPIPIRVAEDWSSMFHEHLKSHGLDPDQLLDWTRMFRMPKVQRHLDDGTVEEQDLNMDFSRMEPLKWTPPREPAQGYFSSKVRRHQVGEMPDPEKLSKPRKADYDRLKSRDFYARLVDGVALADSGRRNQMMVKVIGIIVRAYDTVDPYVPFRLMYRSIQAQVDSGSKWGLEDLWDRCCHFCSLHAGEREAVAAVKKALGQTDADKQERKKTRIEQASEVIGVPEAAVKFHLVLNKGNDYFVFNERYMAYDDACGRVELIRGLRRNCTSLCPETTGPRGGNLSAEEILARYSTPLRDVHAVMGQRDNIYDPTGHVMREGVAYPVAGLEPEYNEKIHKWLTLLGGDRSDKFLDWLGTLLDLQRPTCAMYLHGPPSIGKGMLAEGLGLIWGQAPTPYETLTKDFNQPLAKCPLVVADESIPAGLYDVNASSVFRRLVGSSEFQLKRKFRDEARLMGCPRLLITSNNADALRVRENLTKRDLEAIMLRVGYIICDEAPGDYLESIGGRAETEKWVKGRGLARHVLWLNETRQVKPGSRYLVEGWESDFSQDLVTYSGFNGQTLVALVYFLLDNSINDRALIAGDGRLLVNARALQQNWKLLLGKDAKIPEEYELTNALRAISEDKVRGLPVGDRRINMWQIDLDHVYAVAERQNLAVTEELEKRVNAPRLKEVGGV